MKKSISIIVLSLTLTLFFIWAKSEPLGAQIKEKVDQRLRILMEEDEPLPTILVVLKQKADLTLIQNETPRAEKLRQIYNALTENAKNSQKDLWQELESRGFKYEPYYIVNMVAIYGASPELVKELSVRNEIKEIYGDFDESEVDPRPEDFSLFADEDPQGVGGNISAVGADRVWNELGVRGENIVIAGQDTGIEWDHPALIGQYRGQSDTAVDHNYNWYDAIRSKIDGSPNPCGIQSPVPCDDNDHGTHTVGTIVGDDGVGNQIGMAPKSKWIGCRNMDNGVGRPTTYASCFQFFLAPFPLDGDAFEDGATEFTPHVINNSWGCPRSEQCRGDVLLEILEVLRLAGVFVVVSAGNDGPSCSTIQDTPAWHSAATFSVGANDHRTGRIAGFSSRGPSKFDGEIGPDIAAPGVRIRSSVTGGSYQGGFWSGTSMAGPHVVGLVALMWSANPDLIGNIEVTENIIRETATPVPSASCMEGDAEVVPNNVYGHGNIDAFKAVQAAKNF